MMGKGTRHNGTRPVLGCQSDGEGAVLAVVSFALLGRRKPATKSTHEATAHTAKPGKKDPVISLRAPTKMGDINMANPLKVSSEPQTTATLSGVIPVICMGSVSNVGTYSHEPMPNRITAG